MGTELFRHWWVCHCASLGLWGVLCVHVCPKSRGGGVVQRKGLKMFKQWLYSCIFVGVKKKDSTPKLKTTPIKITCGSASQPLTASLRLANGRPKNTWPVGQSSRPLCPGAPLFARARCVLHHDVTARHTMGRTRKGGEISHYIGPNSVFQPLFSLNLLGYDLKVAANFAFIFCLKKKNSFLHSKFNNKLVGVLWYSGYHS